ncbi:MAG: helix-turn-helix domain-containing protein [Solirubrobacteraceae bacterium]
MPSAANLEHDLAGIAARIFGAARDATGAELYAARTCSLAGGTVRTAGDDAIVVDHDAAALTDADTVVIANTAARSCVVPPWREGGQAQFIERPLPEVSSATTAPTREWALARLREPLTLADLARHGQMSLRTFTRRFRAEVGISPNQWLTRRRVDHARGLLETGDLPVESIVHEAGFGSATSLRRHFPRRAGHHAHRLPAHVSDPWSRSRGRWLRAGDEASGGFRGPGRGMLGAGHGAIPSRIDPGTRAWAQTP